MRPVALAGSNGCLLGKNGNWLKQQALELRSDWVQKMRKSISDDENYPIASALVLGYRGVLDLDTLQRFSKTGTIHVLSVSGLHVGIVFAVFSFLLRWMKGRYLDLAKALLLIALVWMYALLTGDARALEDPKLGRVAVLDGVLELLLDGQVTALVLLEAGDLVPFLEQLAGQVPAHLAGAGDDDVQAFVHHSALNAASVSCSIAIWVGQIVCKPCSAYHAASSSSRSTGVTGATQGWECGLRREERRWRAC